VLIQVWNLTKFIYFLEIITLRTYFASNGKLSMKINEFRSFLLVNFSVNDVRMFLPPPDLTWIGYASFGD